MLRQSLAIVLCCALVTTGCASAAGPRVAHVPQPSVQDKSILADYVQRLAAGSKVRVERTNGSPVRGTLMKATPDFIVVQKNTRIPEPPIELPLAELSRVTLETGGSTGKTVAIGVGAAIAGTLGVLALLAALLGD